MPRNRLIMFLDDRQDAALEELARSFGGVRGNKGRAVSHLIDFYIENRHLFEGVLSVEGLDALEMDVGEEVYVVRNGQIKKHMVTEKVLNFSDNVDTEHLAQVGAGNTVGERKAAHSISARVKLTPVMNKKPRPLSWVAYAPQQNKRKG